MRDGWGERKYIKYHLALLARILAYPVYKVRILRIIKALGVSSGLLTESYGERERERERERKSVGMGAEHKDSLSWSGGEM